MNRIKSGIWTGLVMIFPGLCVSAALYVPGAVGRWYEQQALGQVAYENMPYEPYEIRYYESFEEKLNAIAARKMLGIQTWSLRVAERTANITDEDLKAIAGDELAKLYQAGLLPEELHIFSLRSRAFYEIYELTDKSDDTDEADRLRNIYLWELEFTTDYGTLQLRMDGEYHRIYNFSVYQEPHEQEDEKKWNDWQHPYIVHDEAAVAQGWIDYWELEGVREVSEYHIAESAADGKTVWSGETNMQVHITLQSGNTVVLGASQYGYFGKGWGIYWEFFDM